MSERDGEALAKEIEAACDRLDAIFDPSLTVLFREAAVSLRRQGAFDRITASARAERDAERTRAEKAEARIASMEREGFIDIITAKDRAEKAKAALKSVERQIGNVLYNCRQVPADNERHLASWEGVLLTVTRGLHGQESSHDT